jgi:hypothetical protein
LLVKRDTLDKPSFVFLNPCRAFENLFYLKIDWSICLVVLNYYQI